MTKNKAEKRATRARMAKTGERYTTARHYLLDLHHVQPDANVLTISGDSPDLEADLATPDAGVVEPQGSAERPVLPPRVADPGVSDDAVQRATGKNWDEWLALLDAWNGTAHTHAEIARHLDDAYGIDGWWAQSVTVGYERARGMRALHERPDGFSMSASKTFPVPVDRLFAAFIEADQRERWLDGLELRLRTSQSNKSARFDVLPDEGRLAAYFTAKGLEKCSVQFQQERLSDAGEVERWKAIWKTQLAHLADHLAGKPREQ